MFTVEYSNHNNTVSGSIFLDQPDITTELAAYDEAKRRYEAFAGRNKFNCFFCVIIRRS